MMDTVYRDRQGGEFIYWTYSDGQMVYVKEAWVLRERARGTVRLIVVG
jgi:hypothetical protein